MSRSVSERLRQAGYRVTGQRIAVYEYLQSVKTHPTVEEIHEAVRARFPQMSLATVYNAVDSLVDVGLVRRLNRGNGSARYDGDTANHAHFRCLVCEEVRDVSMPYRPTVNGELDDCEIVAASVEFVGYCPQCRRQRLGLPLPVEAETSKAH
jgi:Fur family peroxide stress response transcriptional regulator